MMQTDLIIIGAGPGGYRAAEYAAKQGLKVVVFEQGEVGGTCLNIGCIPTKTYVHSATFGEARERMPMVVQQLRSGVEAILSHPNITLIREKASFIDRNTVGSVSGSIVTAKNILIATGSETKWLPIQGLGNPRVVDSTGLLALDKQPKKLCIIGAGVIGMEFASVFNRFGTEVTVVEFLKECLPALDSDIAKRLRKLMEKRGIAFHLQCAVKAIDHDVVTFENKKGQQETVQADTILMATGRKPRTEGLNLEVAGIVVAPNGSIPVNDHFETAVPGIYAIGDVNGRQLLAHAAEMQAKVVVNHLSALPSVMPAAIFTHPEAACVGPTEDQLKELGVPYECRKAFHRANGKALAMGDTEGMLKLFSEPNAGRILGCHCFGAHSADMVQEVSVLMSLNATVGQLRNMVHIHPTVNEILLTAAEQ
jgi:dihydrolipoamide dehydrogenase